MHGNTTNFTNFRQTMRRLVPGLLAGLAISLGLGMLLLAVPIYSLQVFDRVLSSGHAETLVLLSLVVVFALVTFGALEAVRSFVLARLATRLGESLAASSIAAGISAGLDGRADGRQLLRDLTVLRQTLTGPAVQALYDAPWLPLAAVAMWVLHPGLGLLALACAALLASLAVVNERLTRRGFADAARAGSEAQDLADAAARKAEIVHALGMLPALGQRICRAHDRALGRHQDAAELNGLVMGATRSVRLMAQAAVLGLGAWLVLRNELTPGMMIAGSILLSRALAPVEQLIGAWRSLAVGREAARRIETALAREASGAPMPLPAPTGRLDLEAVSVAAPDGRAILRDIGLSLTPGEVLGVVGPSAAGKSTFCRLAAGVLTCAAGHLRLDGADIAHYDRVELGRHIGYLPQEPMLFAGSVFENIARMAPDPDPALVMEAARLAGVHEMILRLPNGYDTTLLDGGAPLSGGQRQRVGLARALYGRPRIVILDEPNANLDAAGDTALKTAIAHLKRNGTTVIVASHRPNILADADRILVLNAGSVEHLGSRDTVIQGLRAAPRPTSSVHHRREAPSHVA